MFSKYKFITFYRVWFPQERCVLWMILEPNSWEARGRFWLLATEVVGPLKPYLPLCIMTWQVVGITYFLSRTYTRDLGIWTVPIIRPASHNILNAVVILISVWIRYLQKQQKRLDFLQRTIPTYFSPINHRLSSLIKMWMFCSLYFFRGE